MDKTCRTPGWGPAPLLIVLTDYAACANKVLLLGVKSVLPSGKRMLLCLLVLGVGDSFRVVM